MTTGYVITTVTDSNNRIAYFDAKVIVNKEDIDRYSTGRYTTYGLSTLAIYIYDENEFVEFYDKLNEFTYNNDACPISVI